MGEMEVELGYGVKDKMAFGDTCSCMIPNNKIEHYKPRLLYPSDEHRIMATSNGGGSNMDACKTVASLPMIFDGEARTLT